MSGPCSQTHGLLFYQEAQNTNGSIHSPELWAKHYVKCFTY